MNNVYMGLDVEDFIFGEGTTYENNDIIDNVSEEEMNEFGVIECVEDPDVACYRIALENEQNYNAIMTAMMTREYQVLESTGKEMIYEASKIENFLEMVKKQIQKFWAKVKGVFKKLMDKINSVVLSNKAFVKKYRAVANTIKQPKDAEFTGYEFNHDNLVIPYGEVVGIVKTIKTGDIETALNTLRGKLCHAGVVTADEFAKKLKVSLYGSENTKTVKLESNFTTLLDRLESAASAKKAAKDSHKEAEKAVKGLLSEVNAEKSKARADENEEALKSAKAKSEAISKSLNIMSAALSAQTTAIVASAAQDRRMANHWVKAQNVKDGVKTESAIGEIEVVLI